MATVHGSQILVSSSPHDGDSTPKATSPMRSLENVSVTKVLSNPENRLESIDSTLQPMTLREQSEESSSVVSRRHTLRVLTAFIILFSAGWGDGVTGVVLPYIKQQFQLSYTLSGVLFVAVSSGYVITAFTMERAVNYLGRFPLAARRRLLLPILLSNRQFSDLGFSLTQGRFFLLFIAILVQTGFFLTCAASKTFPGVLVGFFLNGFAKGNLVSALNAYMVANPHVFGLGHMHSFYCIGALTSPLICQTIIARGFPWQSFYYISCALPFLNILLVSTTFRCAKAEFHADKEKAMTMSTVVPIVRGDQNSSRDVTSVESGHGIQPSASRHHLPRNMFMTALRTPVVLAFGFFISMYTGSEGVTSGYIVTYLLKIRHADPSRVGYANSAFWAGAAIGRLMVGFGAPHMGRLKPYWIFVFVTLAIVVHLCIWLIPSFVVGWALTAIVGLVMGPVYPLTLEIACRAVSPAVATCTMAIMSAMANMGGAFYPFLTGLLSNLKGEQVIEPLVVSLMSTMLCFWGVSRAHFRFQ